MNYMKLTRWMVVMALSASVACSGEKNIGGVGGDDEGVGRIVPDPGTYDGSYVIRNDADVEMLKHYDTITGDLGVQAPEMDTFRLPNLETIGGRFLIFEPPKGRFLL